MRILVTNDDGIHAPGLAVAESIARALSDDVWVVAPENEQSGASHSLTLTVPLRVRAIEEKRFAVNGTPTDCVMMAATELMNGQKPALVLSGVNAGSNLADDVTYSGTIAAAMEGCALDIPSIALSQAYDENGRDRIDWSAAAAHGPALVRRLVGIGWPKGTLINVNFPGCPAKDVRGVTAAAQGLRAMQNSAFDRRLDQRGRPYYWLGMRREVEEAPDGTDLQAVFEKKISVTPLHLNLTERAVLEKFRQALAEK